MWTFDYNNQRPSYSGGPPGFPNFNNDGSFGMPTSEPDFYSPAPKFPMPQHDYNSGYGPTYGPPPGPPTHYGSQPQYVSMPDPQFLYNHPPGPPSSAYEALPGPPAMRGFSGPQYQQQHQAYPGSSNNAYSGGPPAARGHPGQQYQQHQGGYPVQEPYFTNDYMGQHRKDLKGDSYQPPPGLSPHPPTQVQSYGPHLQDANNEVVQPFFQYSQCTGKKRALCIGINYFGLGCELKGCINDVHNIRDFLIAQYGYKHEDILTLTDDATDPRMRPTRANILKAMQDLVRDAQPHDSLFFHYSGHGDQIRDTGGDEVDGLDDVIYPVDYQDYESEGYIVDDLIHETMSCHSGTALDLPYVYSTRGKVKEPSLTAEVGQGFLSAFNSYARGNKNIFKNVGLPKMSISDMRKAERIAKATRTSPADVISWSGCKDSEAAADANEAGQATGAMSYAFVTALSKNKHQSYRELLVAIRNILTSQGYVQKPQLSSSHPMDTNIRFIC